MSFLFPAEDPLRPNGRSAVAEPMTDEPLTAIQAARALREVGRWSEQLRHRTIALTWMLWGLVAPAIFVTYAWSDAALAPDSPWTGLLWLPWALLGVSFTQLLWRSARIEGDEPALTFRELAVHVALFLLATVGAALVVIALGLEIAPPAAVLLGLGLLVAMLGAQESLASKRAAGAIQVAGGLALLALGLQLAVAQAGFGQAALWGALASAGVLHGIGAFRYTRS